MKADLIERGITPTVRNALGELAVSVNGERVYSYKEARQLLSSPELLSRIQAKLR